MAPDPAPIHPAARNGPRTPAERVCLDTLQAPSDSQRMPDEMAEAVAVLNPLLDARAKDPERTDAVAERIHKAAQGVRDARSGMACDLALDDLRLALDDARALL